MAAPSDLRSMAPAVFGLAALLVVVALVQDRSIGRWTEVEDARLRSALVDGAREVDGALTQQITTTAIPFVEIHAEADGLADTLAARLRRLPPDALPVQAVYWVEPGAPPALRRLDPDARALVRAGWWEVGDAWRRYFTREPDALRPDAPLRISNEGAPSGSTLAFPALPSPGSPAPFVLVTLDSSALAASALPRLVHDHLGLGDAFDVVIGPEGGAPIYASRPEAGALASPDLVRRVGSRLLTALTVTFAEEGGQRVLEVNQGEIAAGEALWEMRVRHRAGSIGAATSRLRWQQRGLALAVLLVLGGAVALLVRSAWAQRVLARRQMAFVAGVSHELRTPLAVLGSAGENLADGVTTEPEAVRAYGALVRDESRRLAETVESVLALGGVDARTSPREPVRLGEVADEATEAARPALEETGTALALNLALDLPPLLADRRALVAALRNLIVNAARHGGRAATLSARLVGDTVEIAVEDDGPGPPPGADVFEPFVRGEASAKGSGLGLALVRRVAESHGGSARLGRTADGHTRATLTLPISP